MRVEECAVDGSYNADVMPEFGDASPVAHLSVRLRERSLRLFHRESDVWQDANPPDRVADHAPLEIRRDLEAFESFHRSNLPLAPLLRAFHQPYLLLRKSVKFVYEVVYPSVGRGHASLYPVLFPRRPRLRKLLMQSEHPLHQSN